MADGLSESYRRNRCGPDFARDRVLRIHRFCGSRFLERNSRTSAHLELAESVSFAFCSGYAGNLQSKRLSNYDSKGYLMRTVNPANSIWNFHVWTEVWMKRPDVASGDGWQIVDGTPQERSEGLFQCGPAPRSFVKNGTNGNYDTEFVRAEVQTILINFYSVRFFPDGSWQNSDMAIFLSGQNISTKKAGDSDRKDLTGFYRKLED